MTPDPRDGSMAGWKPIDSAPKDGTPILVWGPVDTAHIGHAPYTLPDELGYGGPMRVREAYWRKEGFYRRDEPGWMAANCDEEYGFYIAATHWQSLPSPPKVE